MVPSDRNRGDRHRQKTQEVLSKHKESLFFCFYITESDEALQHLVLGIYGFPILGTIQKLTGQGPGQIALGSPA